MEDCESETMTTTLLLIQQSSKINTITGLWLEELIEEEEKMSEKIRKLEEEEKRKEGKDIEIRKKLQEAQKHIIRISDEPLLLLFLFLPFHVFLFFPLCLLLVLLTIIPLLC